MDAADALGQPHAGASTLNLSETVTLVWAYWGVLMSHEHAFMVVGSELQAAGVERLAGSIALSKFHEMFPDQSNWSHRLLGRGGRSIGKLCEAVDYDGPVELLSMWACLFGDGELRRFSADWIHGRTIELRRAAQQFSQQHGLSPHPVILLRIVAQSS